MAMLFGRSTLLDRVRTIESQTSENTISAPLETIRRDICLKRSLGENCVDSKLLASIDDVQGYIGLSLHCSVVNLGLRVEPT